MKQRIIAEKIILESFCNEPFHTLFFLHRIKPNNFTEGGTCSDKVLSTQQQLLKAGFKVRLHSSFIDGKECHRVLKVWIDDKIYFADIGNGWPSIKLFSMDVETQYECFGIQFSTKIYRDHLKIYQTRNNIKRNTVCIPFQSKGEHKIKDDISKRFDVTSYPFINKFRFSQVIGQSFLFVRDNTLHRYTNSGKEAELVTDREKALLKEFGFNLKAFLDKYGK